MYVNAARAAIRLLLSAAVLMSASARPAIDHAHRGGDKPHQHAQASHARRHGHPHRHHAHLAKRATYKTFEIANRERHVHVSWFGVELTLRAPVLPDDSMREVDGQSQFVVVPCVVVPVDSQSTQLKPDIWLSTQFESGGAHSFMPVPISGRFSNTPAIATPLCDTARHERSGVQLI